MKKNILNLENKQITIIMVLTIIYFFMYFLNVFSVVESVEFMSVDPSSIVGSINNMFETPVYNMNASYHSRVYGWTYFVLNFIALAPFKLLGADPVVINTVIRLLLFVIGFGVLLMFYALSRKISGKTVAFVVSLYFVTNPVVAHFFVTIHPESTGVFFYLAALMFLWKFVDSDCTSPISYVAAISCLTLSALSKQPYAIIAFFIFIGFSYWYVANSTTPFKKLVISAVMIRNMIITIAIVLLVSFVVHPYLFLSFEESLSYQLRPLSHSSGEISDVILPWARQIAGNPLVLFNFFILLLLPFRKSLMLPGVFIYSLIVSIFLTLLFMVMQKNFTIIDYMYPLYPFYVLNLMFSYNVLQKAISRKFELKSFKTGVALLVLLMPYTALNATQSVYMVYKRVWLDGLTTKNEVWKYIRTIPVETKILYIPTVAIPETHKKSSCHVWRNCNSFERIEDYEPEYIMVSWDYRYFNSKIVRSYIEGNEYILKKEVKPTVKVSHSCGVKYVKGSMFSRFDNALSPIKAFGNISDCINKLYDLTVISNNEKISGQKITIYQRKT